MDEIISEVFDVVSEAVAKSRQKKRSWPSSDEKRAKNQDRWGDPALKGAYRSMSDEQLSEIFDRQQEAKSSNVKIAWKYLGCPDNIVPRLQQKVGAKPSVMAGRKKRCKSAVCRLDEIAELKRKLVQEEQDLLDQHDEELAREESELEEKLAKIKAARGNSNV